MNEHRRLPDAESRAATRAAGHTPLPRADLALLRGAESYIAASRKGWGPFRVPVAGSDSLHPVAAAVELKRMLGLEELPPRVRLRLAHVLYRLSELNSVETEPEPPP